MDGTVPFVRELSAQYDLAITTTRNRADTQRFIEQFDLADCFKTVITRQDVKRLKPHPEPVRRAAQELGYSPTQCIVVGDTTVDVQAGKRAGALTVGVLCGFGERPEMARLGPDLLLETTAELSANLPSAEPPWYTRW
jgi:phosphoglycolate phosphatase